MILIGQFDSPFVRRVGIALRLYRIAFEHRPLSVFGDADRIRPYNPLTRVPVLVLDDGECLLDTASILDHVDGLAPASERLMPVAGTARRAVARTVALAGGLSDKAVALFAELSLHEPTARSEFWVERCRRQITDTLAALEAERGAGAFWHGDRLTHADIAAAASFRHLSDAHPELVRRTAIPALVRHSEAMEAREEFRAVSQPFVAPAP